LLFAIGIIAIIPIDIEGYAMASNEYTNGVKVLFHTSLGDIIIQLRSDMPITTGNFKNLVQKGIFNGTIFHRVIEGFMIQGGDPTGTGYGDPSIPDIKDEFTKTNRNDRGTISMANAGPNTGSSQFFINLVNNNFLDTKHPAFGKVISGMDVVDSIAKVATNSNDKPTKNVTIINASIVL
jgi:peptidylprolyl isomerase